MYLIAVRCVLKHVRVSSRDFCFGSFLCAFFFDKVSTLCPHQAVRESGPQELQMHRWCEMMVCEGGGKVGCFFMEELLEQW